MRLPKLPKMPKLPKRPPIKQGGGSGRAKRDHALIVWHPVFQPLGNRVANSWDDMQKQLRGTSYPEYMKDWTIQEWMDDGAVLVEIQRGEDAAVYSVEQPNFTTKDFRWIFDWLAYPEPFMPVAYFYAEHADPQWMKFCDIVPVTVWPPEVQSKVRAYQRGVSKEQARKDAEFDELEQKRKEEEEFRQAGFPPHLDYIPRPPKE